MGDTLALQYGGSDAHSLFFQRQKGDQTGVSKLADQGKVGGYGWMRVRECVSHIGMQDPAVLSR
jgi:hypothetical protein